VFVIVGAGLAGAKAAEGLRESGFTGRVVLVGEESERPYERPPLSKGYLLGTDPRDKAYVLGTGVREFRGDGGQLRSVVLTDGTELPADLAIVGVGIVPATELAEAAGLALDNGVTVDAGLRTSDPDVYAAGDVAAIAHPLLGRIRVEHWSNALNGGKAAARAMLGEPVVYDRIPYFFTDQYDLGMEYAGWVAPGGYDRVVFRGDPAAGPAFLAFWVRDGRVLAGMNVNVWDVQDDIQRLVRAGHTGRPVDLARLADPGVPLGDV
jgi:3-phenylpropionate/trans-cinnamate dioxygenase ferredoxin reductase component